MRFLAFLALILTIFSCTGNRKELKGYLNTLDSVYYDSYYYPEMAKVRFTFVTQQLDSLQKVKLTGEINCIKSFHAYQDGDIELSLDYLKAALPPLIKSDNKVWQARSYLMMGWIAETTGNWHQAKVQFNELLKITMNHSSVVERGFAYLGIARCKNYNKEDNIFETDLGINYLRQSRRVVFKMYGEFTDLSRGLKMNFQDSIESQLLILANRYNKLGLKKQVSSIYSKLYLFYFGEGNYERALKNINEAIKVSSNIKTWNPLMSTYYQRKSTIFYYINQMDSSIYYAFKGIKSNNGFDLMNDYYNYNNLAHIYEDLNNPERSKQYYKKALNNYKKATSLEAIGMAAYTGAAMDFWKYKKDADDQKNRLKSQRRLLLTVLFTMLILGIVIIERMKKIKNNTEHSRFLLYHMLINLGELRNLNFSQNNFNEPVNEKIENMKFIELYFSVFLTRFKELFPVLSRTEIKYAVLMGAGFDDTTISLIFNNSLSSVRKCRQRLKDRLKLDADCDSNQYFSKYFKQIEKKLKKVSNV